MVQRAVEVEVVGAGVVGLATAYTLLKNGFSVHIVAESFLGDTVSDGAGALLLPVFLGDTPAHITSRWFQRTIGVVAEMSERYGYSAVGCHWISGIELHEEAQQSPHWRQYVRDYTECTKTELANYPKPGNVQQWRQGYKYRTVILSPPEYLKFLTNEILAMGGTMEKRRVDNLRLEPFRIVVNCTGFGSRELVEDEKLCAARGQTVKVWCPAIRQFMVFLGKERPFYVLPRMNGVVVLGGTHDREDEDTASRPSEVAEIVRGCAVMAPAITTAPLLGTWAGLRPERSSVRLETERTSSGGIVHNYGHGGGGLSLHWGCAEDVLFLVRQLVRETHSCSKL